MGQQFTLSGSCQDGVMIDKERGSPLISIKDIRDGAAHTIMISEDAAWTDGQWINGQNIFIVSELINCPQNKDDEIRSKHPNGANGLFCDGSSRFLPQEMDKETLKGICTRAGGEAINPF
jgi:prepilin-type processing-associated H-X9-DG protein